MLAGERLYEALTTTYRLFHSRLASDEGCCVFETFPHAVVCNLTKNVVRAKSKSETRRKVLRKSGVEDHALNNIDFVDAALCALTASRLAGGAWHCYGDDEGGFIVVPTARV
jgi:predicted nuclease with RNAse H fold